MRVNIIMWLNVLFFYVHDQISSGINEIQFTKSHAQKLTYTEKNSVIIARVIVIKKKFNIEITRFSIFIILLDSFT